MGFGLVHPTLEQRIVHTEEIMKYKNKHSKGDFIQGGDRNYLPPQQFEPGFYSDLWRPAPGIC